MFVAQALEKSLQKWPDHVSIILISECKVISELAFENFPEIRRVCGTVGRGVNANRRGMSHMDESRDIWISHVTYE